LRHSSDARISEVLALDLAQINIDVRKFQVIGKGNKTRWYFYSEDAAKSLNYYIKYYRHPDCSAPSTTPQAVKSSNTATIESEITIGKLESRFEGIDRLMISRYPHLHEVFLSCCETHLGANKITDDILMIGTGFLCAGARSVISTLWSVNDLATALFSIFYYHTLRQY
jgi:hypothetical protein